MAAYLTALVLQKNNNVFFSAGGANAQKSGAAEVMAGIGLLTEIPTPDGGAVIDGDYWAIPVGEGILTGFNYIPYNPSDPIGSIQPSPMAFKICRIYNRLASDYWYLVGSSAQYLTAYGGGAAMPTTVATLIAGYQKACEFINASNQYGFIFQLPQLVGNQRYYPYGMFNGVTLPGTPANAGYATVSALLTFLNANWTNIGSPVTTIVWTVSADNLTLLGTETAGGGGDLLYGAISAINPSL